MLALVTISWSSIGGAHAGGEPVGDFDQQAIAHGVPEAVVDGLEAIQIDEQDGAGFSIAAPRVAETTAQAVHEQNAVREPGERIVQGIVDQALFGLLASGDVGLRARDAISDACGASYRQTPAEHPAVVAVLVANPVLAVEVAGAPFQVRIQTLPNRRRIVGMDATKPVGGRRPIAVFAQAEHRLPAR
jgi:hypothetical protein